MIVTQKIARVSDDGETCGDKCQFLHGSYCWLDGADELAMDSVCSPIRTSQCRDSEEN